METIVCDTNILIEILKGDTRTVQMVEGWEGEVAISSITVMELFYGALDKRELKKLERFVSLFTILQLTPPISRRATELIRQYAKSHGLGIPDALIAATAMDLRCELLTYNYKDFRFIEGLKLL
ncbi:PIN domain-containing protein [Hydrogenimonas sp.]